MSGTVYEHVAGNLDIALDDLGEKNVKNIAPPVHVWRWSAETIASSPPPDAALSLPDKPSVAVLPFTL